MNARSHSNDPHCRVEGRPLRAPSTAKTLTQGPATVEFRRRNTMEKREQ
jgi:hypothetical protein